MKECSRKQERGKKVADFSESVVYVALELLFARGFSSLVYEAEENLRQPRNC